MIYILMSLWLGYEVEHHEIHGNVLFFSSADIKESPHMEIETDLSLRRKDVLAVCPQWS